MVIMVLTVFMLAACSDKTEDPNNDVTETPNEDNNDASDTPDATPTEEPVVDLGGIDVIVGDWWTADEPFEPRNQQEEDTLAY